MAGDGHAMELLARLGVLQCRVVAGHGSADGAPANAVARLVETHERALQTAGAGQQVARGHMHILQRQPAGDRGAQTPLAVHVQGAEARPVRLDQKAADLVLLIFNLRPDHGHVGNGAGGDPHFFAGDGVAVAGLTRGGGHASGIGPEAGLGEAEAAQLLAAGQGRQPGILLLLGAKGVDRIHHQRRLHAHKAAQSGVAALQFLRHQSILHVGHAGAAVALKAGAKEAQLAHERDELARETLRAEALLDDGDDVVIHKLTRGAPHQQFVFAERGIKMEKVEILKLETHDCS